MVTHTHFIINNFGAWYRPLTAGFPKAVITDLNSLYMEKLILTFHNFKLNF